MWVTCRQCAPPGIDTFQRGKCTWSGTTGSSPSVHVPHLTHLCSVNILRLVSKLSKFQSSMNKVHVGQKVPCRRPPRTHKLALPGETFHPFDTHIKLGFSCRQKGMWTKIKWRLVGNTTGWKRMYVPKKIDWKSTNGAWWAKANVHKIASQRNYWQAKNKKRKEKNTMVLQECFVSSALSFILRVSSTCVRTPFVTCHGGHTKCYPTPWDSDSMCRNGTWISQGKE